MRGLLAAFFLLVGTVASADTAPPRRVLILNSFGPDVSPFVAALSTLRTTLAEELGAAVDFYDVPLEIARFPEPGAEAAFVEFLRTRHAVHRPDIAVPIGAPAAKFVSQHRREILPDVPIVFTGTEPRLLPADALSDRATLVTQRVDLPAMVEDILQLRPDTTEIAIVFGSSNLEHFWVSECRRELAPFADRVRFRWLTGLPLSTMLEQVAALPPHAFVLFGLFVMDGAGVPFDNDDVLRRLHAITPVPLFGYFQSYFGAGPIGGRMYQDTELGRRAARAAIRILQGRPAESLPPEIISNPQPMYDWRELQRWGIPESRLPAGSIVRFRQPTFWDLYRWHVVAATVVCLLQTAMIAALLVSQAKRRAAEATAQSFPGRLLHAQESERARLARELHDDVSQRLARLAIDAGVAERDPAALAVRERIGEVREGLVHLSEDVHALSYQLHPSTLEDLGLVAALRAECERFGRLEGTAVSLDLSEIPHSVSPDTALCLFRVTQEALRNIGRHAQATRVEVSLQRGGGELELLVRDNGVGFAGERADVHPHLGLASMQERVRLLRGRLTITSHPGHGTTIQAAVPLEEERL